EITLRRGFVFETSRHFVDLLRQVDNPRIRGIMSLFLVLEGFDALGVALDRLLGGLKIFASVPHLCHELLNQIAPAPLRPSDRPGTRTRLSTARLQALEHERSRWAIRSEDASQGPPLTQRHARRPSPRTPRRPRRRVGLPRGLA